MNTAANIPVEEVILGNGTRVPLDGWHTPAGGFANYMPKAAPGYLDLNHQYETTRYSNYRRMNKASRTIERLYATQGVKGLEKLVTRIMEQATGCDFSDTELVPSIPKSGTQCLIARFIRQAGYSEPEVGYTSLSFRDTDTGKKFALSRNAKDMDMLMLFAIPSLYDEGVIDSTLVDPNYRAWRKHFDGDYEGEDAYFISEDVDFNDDTDWVEVARRVEGWKASRLFRNNTFNPEIPYDAPDDNLIAFFELIEKGQRGTWEYEDYENYVEELLECLRRDAGITA